MRTIAIVMAVFVALAGLAGCAEKPQQLDHAKKEGAPAWKGTNDAFAVPGWTQGDQKSWETQLRTRAQRGQDEYPRTGPAS